MSDSSVSKENIQALVRACVILRDGGCILRHYPEAGSCGGYRNDGELILQAEHLITRANSATYGDLRNIVCLCRNHHGYWKPQYSKKYWDIIKKHLGARGWAWYERAEADSASHKTHKMDWKLVEIDVKMQLKRLQEVHNNTLLE